jgi:hypothetical protein
MATLTFEINVEQFLPFAIGLPEGRVRADYQDVRNVRYCSLDDTTSLLDHSLSAGAKNTEAPSEDHPLALQGSDNNFLGCWLLLFQCG